MKNKRDRRTLVLTVFLCLLPAAAGLAFYHRLPDQVATHWGMSGEPNGYSSRAFAAVGMPLILLALHLVLWLLLESDPKNKGVPSPVRAMSRWIIPVISLGTQTLVLYNALAQPVDPTLAVTLFMGVMFTALGNYLPKCRQSYTVGIRLPWTLNDEDNWNRTHRLAGWLWTVGGILIIITAFFRAGWLMTAILTAMVAVPVGYSYLFYRRKAKEAP